LLLALAQSRTSLVAVIVVTMGEMRREKLYAQFGLQHVSQALEDWRGDVT
jgi:hypothetical protein